VFITINLKKNKMKNKLLLFVAMLLLGNFQVSAEPNQALTLIHYWNFNTLSPKMKAARDVVASPIPSFSADFSLSAASLMYQAIPGTSSPYNTYSDSVLFAAGTGTPVNMRNSDAAGLALRLRNPSDQMQLVFEYSI
jgi:hypothetical protein